MGLNERLDERLQANKRKATTVFDNEMEFFEEIGKLCTEKTRYLPKEKGEMPKYYDSEEQDVYRLDNGLTVIRSKNPTKNLFMEIYLTGSRVDQRGAVIDRGYDKKGRELVVYNYEDPVMDGGLINFIVCYENEIRVRPQPIIKTTDNGKIYDIRDSKKKDLDVALMDGATIIDLLKESFTGDSIVLDTIIGDFEKILATVDRSIQPETSAEIELREKKRRIKALETEHKAQIEGLTNENRGLTAQIEGLTNENRRLTEGIKGAVTEGERRGPFDSRANRFNRVIAELSKALGITTGEIDEAGKNVEVVVTKDKRKE